MKNPNLENQPAGMFAKIGFTAVLQELGGPSAPEMDWSEEGGSEQDHAEYVAARERDQQRVSEWLRSAKVSPLTHGDGIMFGPRKISWPDRIPVLKTWAGRQTLTKLVKQRQSALVKDVTDVLSFEAPINGASGLYKPCAGTALEDGFSVDAVGMKRITPVGLELLAIIGLETLAITVHPDNKTLSFTIEDTSYSFEIEGRNEYYHRWSEVRSTKQNYHGPSQLARS